MVKTWLRCTVHPGQFSDEYAVKALDAEGNEIWICCPEDYLCLTEEPSWERGVEGWMEVDLVDQQGDLAAVRLPRLILGSGQHATVRTGQLEQRRIGRVA